MAKKATQAQYKSVRTLLKAFVEKRISHDEYLTQSERLREQAQKDPPKRA